MPPTNRPWHSGDGRGARTPLSADAWRTRRAAHERRVGAWIMPYLARRRRGEKHPVEDSLFTYYSYRPTQLRRWHPGTGVVLADADPGELGPDYAVACGGATLDTTAVLSRRRDLLTWVHDLLTRTSARPAHIGCFGMHEWAMVYRQSQEEVRHAAWPLRLTPTRTAEVVERTRIRCSHFDAYRAAQRAFAERAAPLRQRLAAACAALLTDRAC